MSDEPKTRREKKGRDKQSSESIYSARHVRERERLLEKKPKPVVTENPAATEKKKLKNF
jgi:hypothetical protein